MANDNIIFFKRKERKKKKEKEKEKESMLLNHVC